MKDDDADERESARDELCREIMNAFEQAGLSTAHLQDPAKSYGCVVAYQDYGYGGMRSFLVVVEIDRRCHAFMTPLYDLPEAGGEVSTGPAPRLFVLPDDTPNLAAEIVARLNRAAAEEASGSDASSDLGD